MQTRAGLAIKRALRGSLGLAIILALMTAAVASAQDATVTLSSNPNFGTILTDSNGMTLYTWQGDQPGVSNCTGNCATVWPPLTTDGDVMAPAGLTGTLGVIHSADGTMIVTYNDWPLYRFARDTAPGDTNGSGVNGFGAVWQVAVVEGATAATVPLPAVVTQPMGPAVPAQVAPAPAVAAVAAVQAQQPTPTPTPTATPTTVPGRTLDVTMVDFDYMPRNIRITVGDSVRFTNRGRAPHTATSNNPNMGFDSGRLDPGQSWTTSAFTTAGTVNYHCEIHPNMQGSITVMERPSGAAPESAGGQGYRYGFSYTTPYGYGMPGPYSGGPPPYFTESYNLYRWGYAGYPFYSYYLYPSYGPVSYYGYPYYAGYMPYYGYGVPFYGYPYYPGYSPFLLGGTYPYPTNGLAGFSGYGYPYYGYGYGSGLYGPYYGAYLGAYYGAYFGSLYGGYGGYGYGGYYPFYPYPYYPYLFFNEQAPAAEDPGITLTAASTGTAGAEVLTASLNPAGDVGPMQLLPNTVTVQIFDNGYQPSAVTVPIGGSVQFTNFGTTPHSATSDTAGQFDSGVLQRGQSYTTPAFNTAGTFTFHDSQNAALRGTISVSSTAATPYYPYNYPAFGYGYTLGGYPYYYSAGYYYPYSGFYNAYPYGYFDPLYGPYAYGGSYTLYGGYPYYGFGYGYGYGYGYPYYLPGYGYPQGYGPYYWTQLY